MKAFNSSHYYTINTFNSLAKGAHNQLRVFHLNGRSIGNKQEELHDFLNSLSVKFDLLLFTETWLTVNEEPPFFENYAYQGIVRSYGRGGVVAAYIKKPVSHEVILDFSVVDNDVECLTVRLENNIAVVFYRPPAENKTRFFELLDGLLRHLIGTGLSFVIMGDVNINMLSIDAPSRKLTELVTSYTCVNVIVEATRVTSNTASLLDVHTKIFYAFRGVKRVFDIITPTF